MAPSGGVVIEALVSSDGPPVEKQGIAVDMS
jgi:hypothetical protein